MLHIIIAIACLTATVTASSPIDQMKQVFLNQIERATVVDLLLEHLSIQFVNEQSDIGLTEYQYCSEIPGDSICSGKSQAVNDAEKQVIIRTIQAGFVQEDSIFSDEMVALFSGNLCLVVQFKNNTEYTGISPLIASKQIVFCAKSTGVGQELIHISLLGEVNQNPSHGMISGWRCFNNPDFERNDGLAMGDVVIDTEAYGFLNNAKTIWSICSRSPD
ncbi:MAG: hypothetical protein CMF46_01200 [Legionellales bacterium]|nr:hypothetical protein [Legionellales bacterium]|tara:strand:- start:382 stop:1035 length:654 start_codon:yes stop_codon:yes gene_type:complete